MSQLNNEEQHSGTRPFDFAIHYEFHSVDPSPHGTSFLMIEVAPDGSGEIRYEDNGAFQGDEFVAIFQPEESQLERLYRLMLGLGILEPMWQPPRAPQKPDSGHVHLGVTCGGNFFDITPAVKEDEETALQPVYDAIRALVPQDIWDKIKAKKESSL